MTDYENVTETIGDHLIREKYIEGGRYSGSEGECLACGEWKMLKGRGLCMKHYQQARRGGYLSSYPRAEVYDPQWMEDVVGEYIKVHGRVKFMELSETMLDLDSDDSQPIRMPKKH